MFKVFFFPNKFAIKKKYNSAGEISCVQFHVTSCISQLFLKTVNMLSLFCSLYDEERISGFLPLTPCCDSGPWQFCKAGYLLQILAQLSWKESGEQSMDLTKVKKELTFPLTIINEVSCFQKVVQGELCERFE